MRRLAKSSSANGRRLSVAALASGAVAMLVIGATPAFAAASVTVSPSDTTFTTPGSVTLTASANESSSLKSIQSFEVVLTATDGTPAYSARVVHGNVFKKADSICLSWNPNAGSEAGGNLSGSCGAPATPATVANGTYRLTSTMWTCTVAVLGSLGCVDTPTATAGPARTFKVSIPPKTPSGVKAALEGTSPLVTWSANPEPDITGYRVFRTDVNKQVGTVIGAKVTTWRDPCTTTAPCTPGTNMTYKVAAVRKSPVQSAGVVSAWSGASSAVALPVLTSSPSGPGASPSASAAVGAGNPLNIPAHAPSPLAGVTAPTKQIIGKPPISDKYAPTLPYSAPLPADGPAPVEAGDPTVEAARAERQVAVESAGQQRLPKLQFIAGALALLVAALHLARGGGILLRGTGKGSSETPKKGRAGTA